VALDIRARKSSGRVAYPTTKVGWGAYLAEYDREMQEVKAPAEAPTRGSTVGGWAFISAGVLRALLDPAAHVPRRIRSLAALGVSSSAADRVEFDDVGPVELKGVAIPVKVSLASLA